MLDRKEQSGIASSEVRLTAGLEGRLRMEYAEDFARAGTDDARRRVIVDQVASLTDRFAISWHSRLVGSVDLESIGIWVPGSRIVASTAYALPEPLEGL